MKNAAELKNEIFQGKTSVELTDEVFAALFAHLEEEEVCEDTGYEIGAVEENEMETGVILSSGRTYEEGDTGYSIEIGFRTKRNFITASISVDTFCDYYSVTIADCLYMQSWVKNCISEKHAINYAKKVISNKLTNNAENF